MWFWLKKITNMRKNYDFWTFSNFSNSRGTYTLSEIFGRSTKERIAKLPKYDNWSSHKLACLQFTLVRFSIKKKKNFFYQKIQGTTSEPKLVALSHYQLLNGARAVVTAFGIKMEVKMTFLNFTKIFLARPSLRLADFSNSHLFPGLFVAVFDRM